jgi:deoxycytidylate deaminase
MCEALKLAQVALLQREVPVGCVITRNGKIVSTGASFEKSVYVYSCVGDECCSKRKANVLCSDGFRARSLNLAPCCRNE